MYVHFLLRFYIVHVKLSLKPNCMLLTVLLFFIFSLKIRQDMLGLGNYHSVVQTKIIQS